MLYSPMCLRGRGAFCGRRGMPTVARRCSCTRSTPHTIRFTSRTGPPPMRQLISISRGPCDVYLASTWNTPILSPSAAQLRTAKSTTSACLPLGRRDGQLEPVSLNHGSMHGQLSVMAAYTAVPSESTRSMSTSSPSKYSSTMSETLNDTEAPSASAALTSAPEETTSPLISAWTLWKASRNSPSLFALITPRDAAPLTGLITAGNPTFSAAAAMSPSPSTIACATLGSPAASMARLASCLSRAASTAAGGLEGNPRAVASRDTRGMASSQKEHTPDTPPGRSSSLSKARMASRHRSNTVSASDMSMGTNFCTTPSSTSARLQL
mmetsp:Transcript_22179/g.69016  ORF Transcript_22179/g.69016 Transcript_22179/m.69016 type:complete len:324 (-) Transcript_22179:96-1067(-)